MIYLTKRAGIFSLEYPEQFSLLASFKQEAGIRGAIHESEYDSLLTVAGSHGYGLSVTEKSLTPAPI